MKLIDRVLHWLKLKRIPKSKTHEKRYCRLCNGHVLRKHRWHVVTIDGVKYVEHWFCEAPEADLQEIIGAIPDDAKTIDMGIQ